MNQGGYYGIEHGLASQRAEKLLKQLGLWEKRFQTRVNRLKMYGASGRLYSAAQQAFLARLSTDNLDKIAQLQYTDPRDWPADSRTVQGTTP